MNNILSFYTNKYLRCILKSILFVVLYSKKDSLNFNRLGTVHLYIYVCVLINCEALCATTLLLNVLYK